MGGKVFKAVIPAAGRGMRMRPLSLALPKEMMPLGRKIGRASCRERVYVLV